MQDENSGRRVTVLWEQVAAARERAAVTVFERLLPDTLIFVRQVRDSQSGLSPDDVPIPYEEVKNPCRTNFALPITGAGAVHATSAVALLLPVALQALLTAAA